MSFTPQTITILRATRARDGAGGQTEVFAPVGTAACTVHYYVKTSLFRIEEAAHNSEGPGKFTRSDRFFSFKRPFPDIRVNDRVQTADGLLYTVFYVRNDYGWTMQVDCEDVS